MSEIKSVIGTRIRIEYSDQNEGFASLLPRYGTVLRKLRDVKGNDDWFLIKLEAPFDYHLNDQAMASFPLLHCENVLIRSRWQGYQVGEIQPTSVFILLIPDETQMITEPIRVEKFYHVAWGICHTE